MKLLFLVYILFLYPLLYLVAGSNSNLLERKDMDYPLTKTVYWEETNNHDLALLPEISGAEGMRLRFMDFKPEFMVERLYKLELPEQYLCSNDPDHKKLFTAIIKAFGNPETQMRYTYHSTTRNKDIELFEKSYISDIKGRQITGFSFNADNLPKEYSYYQYIDEANFSGTVFEQQLLFYGDSLLYQSTNLGRVKFIIFPVMSERGSRNEVLFFVDNESLYIYDCAQVDKKPPSRIMGIPVRLSSMLKKRMDVMVQWIGDQL